MRFALHPSLRRLQPLTLAVALAAAAVPALAGEGESLTRKILETGNYYAGERDLGLLVSKRPGDGDARFGLGLVQFALAIQNFGRHNHYYGLKPRQEVPFLRLPVPANSNPALPTYEIQRAALQALLDGLNRAERTLNQIQSDNVKIHFDLEKVQLDFRWRPDPSPSAEPQEPVTLMQIVRSMNPALARTAVPPSQPAAEAPFEVAFDRADAFWLQGYCHLLAAGLEFVLAHDWREAFDKAGGLFYPRLRLKGELDTAERGFFGDQNSIADAITLIHEIRWTPIEPDRLRQVREHLKQVIALSRLSWKAILAETDDEQEWIAGPGQKNAAMPSMQITQARLDTWLAALDEFEAVLDGRKLLPHWRFAKGINLRRVFEEPGTFDLVLWATGTGALPYLEDGPVISSATWRSWQTVFGGNFLTFAVYLN